MVGESGTSNNHKVYHYYKCATAKKKKGCNKKFPRKGLIEEFVIKQLYDILLEPEIINSIGKGLLNFRTERTGQFHFLKNSLQRLIKTSATFLRKYRTEFIRRQSGTGLKKLRHRKPILKPRQQTRKLQSLCLRKNRSSSG